MILILTNHVSSIAIREHNHSFDSIEILFKSQKTNGFNLEKTHTRNIRAFQNLYFLVLIANVWMTILGGMIILKNIVITKRKSTLDIKENVKTILKEFFLILILILPYLEDFIILLLIFLLNVTQNYTYDIFYNYDTTTST